jgi:NADH dehydrogenase
MWLKAWFILQDQILPEVAPKLREFARKKMEKAGITMLLNTRAVAATHEGVELNDGRMLTGATVVCTIGTAISPIVQALDVPKERGRIRTTPEMRIEGQSNAWAIGDCAHIINAFDNKPAAPTGQFAERQGRQAALNVVRILKAEPTQPFRFKALGRQLSLRLSGCRGNAGRAHFRLRRVVPLAQRLPLQTSYVVSPDQGRP